MAINIARALQPSIAISRLHVPTYEEVEHDRSATAEAGAVVAPSRWAS